MPAVLRHPFLLFTFAALTLVATPSRAEDIDIFSGIDAQNELPNVLIIWDSSANWGADISVPNCSYSDGSGGPKATAPNKEQGKKFAIEKCAIYNVIVALPLNDDGTARFNVGLMLFNESGAAQGGYPRKQFLPLTAVNKVLLLNTVRNIAVNDDKANNGPYAQAMQEAYLMFARKAPYRGTLGTKWDPAAVVSGKYVGAPGNGCGNNHIIWVSNGSPNENNTDALSVLQSDGGDTAQLVYPTSYITNSDQADWADEFARWMRGVDVSPMDGVQSITTHAVAVIGASSDGLYPNYIHAIATQGGGQYYAASNIDQLVAALLNIFNSIQAVDSVFASSSLPISVNAQGTYKNQVFVGMFRPDQLARPRWYGNLKQYQMLYDPATDTLDLGDSLGVAALNASTGFFRPSAVSYWTSASNFWVNDPKGTPKSASDRPDGEVVEKGGVAEKLRVKYATDQSGRRVLTCIGCPDGTTLTLAASETFVDGNTAITAAMLGAADPTERTSIINWVRGNDNHGDELGPGSPTTVRPSVHGDVLHSRPAVVDYGGSIGTIAFYGGNDGMLHAIDGNQTGGTSGQELWAFVPSEVFGRLKRLRDEVPVIKFPSTPSGTVATPRDYFVDGSITVYERLDANRVLQQVVIYVTMRRGGRFLYAFDVTDPSAPKMLWRKSNASLSLLGQTWSDLRVATVLGYSNPVLVMGAGYDPTAEDATPPGTTTMGNAIVVLDALDGSLVKTLATSRSVPAPVALLDSDFDGYVDRAYAVDAGANVYRIDFETSDGTSKDSWTITKFAALNATGRKFFYAPDVVQTKLFTAVMVGSGDREKPLATLTADRFYTLLDYKVTKGTPSASPLTDGSLVPNDGAFAYTGNPAGCYLALDTHGEKVVTASVSTGGYAYFSTNRPTPPSTTSCANNLGLAKTYRVPLFCGVAESIELAGGGLPPSPVLGMVDVSYTAPGGGTATKTVPFIIGGFSPELSGLAVSRVPINVDPTRKRTYWFTNKER
jgi:type IV pilus assembly protein PilY1